MTLRTGVFAVALAVFIVAVVAWLAGNHDAAPFALWGGVIAVAVWVERWRYRARDAAADGSWQPTDERFIDPESGQAMRVFYNPRTGERRYDRAAEGPPGAA